MHTICPNDRTYVYNIMCTLLCVLSTRSADQIIRLATGNLGWKHKQCVYGVDDDDDDDNNNDNNIINPVASH